jgi:hypothetical protein
LANFQGYTVVPWQVLDLVLSNHEFGQNAKEFLPEVPPALWCLWVWAVSPAFLEMVIDLMHQHSRPLLLLYTVFHIHTPQALVPNVELWVMPVMRSLSSLQIDLRVACGQFKF